MLGLSDLVALIGVADLEQARTPVPHSALAWRVDDIASEA